MCEIDIRISHEREENVSFTNIALRKFSFSRNIERERGMCNKAQLHLPLRQNSLDFSPKHEISRVPRNKSFARYKALHITYILINRQITVRQISRRARARAQ